MPSAEGGVCARRPVREDAAAKRAIFRDGTIDFSDCKGEMGGFVFTER